MVRCNETCLSLARSQRPRLVLAPVAPCVLAPRDLSQICKREPLTKCNAWGAKSDMLQNHAQLNHINSLQAIYEFAPIIFSI
jgi:hypothetical protein